MVCLKVHVHTGTLNRQDVHGVASLASFVKKICLQLLKKSLTWLYFPQKTDATVRQTEKVEHPRRETHRTSSMIEDALLSSYQTNVLRDRHFLL